MAKAKRQSGSSGKAAGGGYTQEAWQKAERSDASAHADEAPMMATLRAEHRQMASVMQLFTQQLDAIAAGKLVDPHVVYEVMAYMIATPDQYHHPREDVVYQRAAEKDASAADSVDTLQREHDAMAQQGEQVLRHIEEWRSGNLDGLQLVAEGRAYVQRIYDHMSLEEEVVFPQVEALLTTSDWRELEREDQLRPAEDPVFGRAVDREFRNLARKLRRGVRRGVERATLVEWISIESLMEAVEVMSIGYDNGRSATGDHLQSVLDESLQLMQRYPLTGPWRCAANNTRLTVEWLGEIADVSKDTVKDLAKVDQERRDRIRLLDNSYPSDPKS